MQKDPGPLSATRVLLHNPLKQPNTRIHGYSSWPPRNLPASLPAPERARCGPAAAPPGEEGAVPGPALVPAPAVAVAVAARPAPRTRRPRSPTYGAAGCSPAAPPSLTNSLPPVRSWEGSGAALPRLGASAAPVSARQRAGGRRRPVSRGRGAGPLAASGSRGEAALPAGLRAGRAGCREILAPRSAAWDTGKGGENPPQ